MKAVRQSVLRAFFLFVAASVLSSCSLICGLFGNGEGYCGKTLVPAEKWSAPESVPPGFEPRETIRIYYQIDPRYQCQLPSGEMVQSYKSLIRTSSDGTFVQYGDPCHPNAVRTGNTVELDTHESDYVGFEGGIFQRGGP